MLSVEDLPSAVPSDAARYHVFRFKHSHEGDYLESNGETFSTETEIIFSFSVHLLHAWILCAYQGEDDVLQLQERGGGGAGEVAQHTAGEEGGDRLWFRAHPGLSSVRAASSAEPQQA